MDSNEPTKRPATPPSNKRTSGDLTPSIREKSAQRQISSSVSRTRPINHGNDDVIPTVINSTYATFPPSYLTNPPKSSKKKNKNKNKKESTITNNKHSTNNKSTAPTKPDPTTTNLQSSIKFFFQPSENADVKYEGKSVIPVPSSTIASSEIAPDPSEQNIKMEKDTSTTKNITSNDNINDADENWGFENEDNFNTTLYDNEGNPISNSTLKEEYYNDQDQESGSEADKKINASAYKEEDQDSDSNDQSVSESDSSGKDSTSSASEEEDDDDISYYSPSSNSSSNDNDEVATEKVIIHINDSDSENEDDSSYYSEVNDGSNAFSTSSVDSDKVYKPSKRLEAGSKIEDSILPPRRGETLEPEDISNYVVTDEDGTPTKLKPSVYYNSLEAQQIEQKVTNKQMLEYEREEKVKLQDKKLKDPNDPDNDATMVDNLDHVSKGNHDGQLEEKPKDNTVVTPTNEDKERNENDEASTLEGKEEDTKVSEVQKEDGELENDEVSTKETGVDTDEPMETEKENEKEEDEVNKEVEGEKPSENADHEKDNGKEEDKKNDNIDQTSADKEEVDRNVKEKEENDNIKDPENHKATEEPNQEETQDDDSVKTAKMGTHWGEKGPPPDHVGNQNQVQTNSTEQDEINSVNSGETTHKMSQEEASKEIAPLNTRYQYTFSQEAESIAQIKEGLDTEQQQQQPLPVKSYAERCQDEIKSILVEMKKVDKDCCIISWNEEKTFSTLRYDPEKDNFPKSTAEITKFFPGYKSNATTRPQPGKSNRLVQSYISIRVHHPNTTNVKFEQSMSAWANLNSKKFKKTIIQTEKPRIVGWLLYSSNYTDTTYLKSFLQKKTGYEWGFRISPVSKTDQKINGVVTPYRDRVKALTALVDEKNLAEAPKVLANIFTNEPITSTIHSFENRYTFIDIENKWENQDEKEAFSKMVGRQKLHSELLVAQFYPWIDINIDKKIFDLPGSNKKVSLRELVLSIPAYPDTEDGNEEQFFEPLFHGFDFTMNSAEQWFDGFKGPGGSGHIFTSYKHNSGRARRMIQGMGIYLATIYKDHKNIKTILASCFSVDHWKASKGWAWNEVENSFITTESANLYRNLLQDTNRAIVQASDENLVLEQEKEEKEKATLAEKKKALDHLKAKKEKQKQARKKDKTYLSAAKALQKTKKWEESKPATKVIDSTDMLKIKINTIRRKQFDPDEDSINLKNGKGTAKGAIVDHVHMSDNISTTSSLTDGSLASTSVRANQTANEKDDASIDSATSSLKSFTDEYLDNILEQAQKDPNVKNTPEEIQKLAHSALMMKVNKAILKGTSMIDKRLKSMTSTGEPSDKKKYKKKKSSRPKKSKRKKVASKEDEEDTPVKKNPNHNKTSSLKKDAATGVASKENKEDLPVKRNPNHHKASSLKKDAGTSK